MKIENRMAINNEFQEFGAVCAQGIYKIAGEW